MPKAALTCPWEKVVSIFVEGYSHDAVGQVKGFLDAVAMVNVYVDVQDPGVVPATHTRTHTEKYSY